LNDRKAVPEELVDGNSLLFSRKDYANDVKIIARFNKPSQSFCFLFPYWKKETKKIFESVEVFCQYYFKPVFEDFFPHSENIFREKP
jgi:hypothetical protein